MDSLDTTIARIAAQSTRAAKGRDFVSLSRAVVDLAEIVMVLNERYLALAAEAQKPTPAEPAPPPKKKLPALTKKKKASGAASAADAAPPGRPDNVADAPPAEPAPVAEAPEALKKTILAESPEAGSGSTGTHPSVQDGWIDSPSRAGLLAPPVAAAPAPQDGILDEAERAFRAELLKRVDSAMAGHIDRIRAAMKAGAPQPL